MLPARPVGSGSGSGVSSPLSATLLGVHAALAPSEQPVVETLVEVGGNVASETPGVSGGSASATNTVDGPGLPVIKEVPLPPPIPEPVKEIPPVTVAPTVYFRRSELTVAPVLKDEPAIELPDSAEQGPKGGKLALRLLVGANGVVDRVELVSSTLPADFDEAAIAAFVPLHFRPGEIDGVQVRSQVIFEIDLRGPVKGASRSTDQAAWNLAPKDQGNPRK